MKVITWVDLEGRYRVTSPAYGDPTNPLEETEGEAIARVLVKIKERYGLPDTHTFHFVEDVDQRTRLSELVGTYFRYGVFDQDARAGAWEMDVDGRPKINIAKARLVHMDRIRVMRDAGLRLLDIEYLKADEAGDAALKTSIATEKRMLRDIPQTFDLTVAGTPDELKAMWPAGLPPQ